MREKLTKYLKELSANKNIGKQYLVEEYSIQDGHVYTDPLMEDDHEVVKGLIHKYKNRALIKVSYHCAAHCRFCTRIRQIGTDTGTLTDADIDNIIAYLVAHPEIDDVILSGGDPFYTPHITEALLTKLKDIESVKVLRIGTRLPVQSPISFSSKPILRLLELVKQVASEKPFYILVHIEHPDELTPEVLSLFKTLRQQCVTLLSQTVFLKGINDDVETLYQLFRTLYHNGVTPYYLYHCDKVAGLENFAVPLEAEIEIATELHRRLSGIACPRFVIDVNNGYGKLPVPLAYFSADVTVASDIVGTSIRLD